MSKLLRIASGIALILLLSSCALKPILPYTPTEKVLLGTAIGGQVTDLVSTHQKLSEGCVESNPILQGETGVDIAKVIMIPSIYFISNYLDHTGRKIFLGTATVIGVGATVHNYNLECN